LVFPWNCLKIKTLRRTWTDQDTVLLHANFQILTNFVEKELFVNPIVILEDEEKEVQWMHDCDMPLEEIQKAVEQIRKSNNDMLKLMKLYKWWKVQRPIRENNYPDYPASCKRGLELINTNNVEFHEWAKKHEQYEQMCDQEDTDKLIELIKIRKYMWT
jgi:hypothetical protein